MIAGIASHAARVWRLLGREVAADLPGKFNTVGVWTCLELRKQRKFTLYVYCNLASDSLLC